MKLICFGLGYTAQYVIERLVGSGCEVIGTTRKADKIRYFRTWSVAAKELGDIEAEEIASASHILITIPPEENAGDIVYAHYAEAIGSNQQLQWLGYLSTTGVYGDHRGGWVDEATATAPQGARGQRRVDAEQLWLTLHRRRQTPTHIFRLAGIYGPGRNVLDNIAQGKARSIDKPGQYFSRIHVQDIAGILVASMRRPTPGEVYNVCDDKPGSSIEVNEFAAGLLGCDAPPRIPFDEAELSSMQQDFYASSRRVRNDKVKQALAYNLLYPSYKEGLRALYPQHRQA